MTLTTEKPNATNATTETFRVEGWDEGCDNYPTAEAAITEYSAWSGGWSPEEDGLKVVKNQ